MMTDYATPDVPVGKHNVLLNGFMHSLPTIKDQGLNRNGAKTSMDLMYKTAINEREPSSRRNGFFTTKHKRNETDCYTSPRDPLDGDSTNVTTPMAKTADVKMRQKSQPRTGKAPSKGLEYGLSVSETVKMGSKLMNQQYGIQGYELKLWHHDINKPIVFGIHQDKYSKKPRHYLDPLIKQKEHVPPPTSYNVCGDFKLK